MKKQNDVLHLDVLHEPVLLRRVEVRRMETQLFLCVYDQHQRLGLSFACSPHAAFLLSLLEARILPVAVNRDLRDWESLLEDIYLHHSNYKMQGLAFWLPVALLEMAVLDLLGRVAGCPMGALFGSRRRTEVRVYEAFHDREHSAEELVDTIEMRLAASGATAAKFKLGGRMRRDEDCRPGRSDSLPALLRARLGTQVRLYADANGSYSPREAIRIGRILEAAAIDFFEEPCPFDHFDETREVADALDIHIAGGEQDGSLYRLQWMLKHGALQVVQPDLFYIGGMVRSMKIARFAQTVGAVCTPHISGYGLGALYMAHFVSALDNPAQDHEYKGAMHIPGLDIPREYLHAHNSVLRVPDGSGIGFEVDPDWIARSELLLTCGGAASVC